MLHVLVGFVVGFAVGGAAVGYVAYTYGKKVAAAVVAVQSAAQEVKKA